MIINRSKSKVVLYFNSTLHIRTMKMTLDAHIHRYKQYAAIFENCQSLAFIFKQAFYQRFRHKQRYAVNLISSKKIVFTYYQLKGIQSK